MSNPSTQEQAFSSRWHRRTLEVMATFSSVTSAHVHRALAEHDTRGAEEFGAAYGFDAPSGYTLLHEGRRYDATAVLGVAHRHATGRLATPEEFRSDMAAAVGVLRRRGFEVVEPPRATRAAPTRVIAGHSRTPRPTTTRPSTRAAATRDVPPAICPTCSMALPATGVCDDCG
jgi:hypothetical protein